MDSSVAVRTTALSSGLVVAQGGRGRLVVNSLPWARVFVDGRDYGLTPMMRDVPAGRHTLRLVTQDGREMRRTVEVRADETSRVVLRF